MIAVRASAPHFALPDQDGNIKTLEQYRGSFILLAFYPGDNTPICTRQLRNYSAHWAEFSRRGINVVGINPQSPSSHKYFCDKHSFPFPLLSDSDGIVCEQYGAHGMFGTKRAYVLIDPEQIIIYSKAETLPLFYRTAQDLFAIIDECHGL